MLITNCPMCVSTRTTFYLFVYLFIFGCRIVDLIVCFWNLSLMFHHHHRHQEAQKRSKGNNNRSDLYRYYIISIKCDVSVCFWLGPPVFTIKRMINRLHPPRHPSERINSIDQLRSPGRNLAMLRLSVFWMCWDKWWRSASSRVQRLTAYPLKDSLSVC